MTSSSFTYVVSDEMTSFSAASLHALLRCFSFMDPSSDAAVDVDDVFLRWPGPSSSRPNVQATSHGSRPPLVAVCAHGSMPVPPKLSQLVAGACATVGAAGCFTAAKLSQLCAAVCETGAVLLCPPGAAFSQLLLAEACAVVDNGICAAILMSSQLRDGIPCATGAIGCMGRPKLSQLVVDGTFEPEPELDPDPVPAGGIM
mmetsp:Transcript_5375/g.21301  ORF Transcript_5375/g.21301 Transcript_5375/m.21301 type:complete len:201 (+) Transcript_5375:3738-4340(+)